VWESKGEMRRGRQGGMREGKREEVGRGGGFVWNGRVGGKAKKKRKNEVANTEEVNNEEGKGKAEGRGEGCAGRME